MEQRLVPLKDAADQLGLSARTLQRWCREHRIEHTRPGGRYFLPERVVQELGKTVPATKSRRRYQKKHSTHAQGDRELAERLLQARTEPGAQGAEESTLTDLERLKLYYTGRIHTAKHADEARMLRVMLQQAKRGLASTQQPGRDGHYPNPDLYA